MGDAAVITAILVGFTGLVTVFLKFFSDMTKAQARRDDLFAKSLNENTKAMRSVAAATTRSAKEAADRNGHLAELAIENKEATLKALSIIKGNVSDQHVTNQYVDNQTKRGE